MVKPKINKQILSIKITIITITELIVRILSEKNLSIAVCNINTVVNADKDDELNNIINSFDLRVADGMPLVWYLNLKKIKQERLNGSKILYKVIEAGLNRGTKHYFLGSSNLVLSKMINNLKIKYPDIQIGGFYSPPVGSVEEIMKSTLINLDEIKKSDILWVGLGMPKQEQLISQLKNVEIVKIGVGAVFEWIAGTKKQAPLVLQNMGLEWLYRLLSEPKRLWRRYFYDFTYLVRILFKKYLFKN